MSQHIIEAKIDGKPVHVLMGWDSPLQWFFLVISPYDEDGELDDPTYSNINELDPQSKTLDYYLDICQSYGINIPEKMAAGVRADHEMGLMNGLVRY